MECQKSNAGLPSARQVSYCLYYLFSLCNLSFKIAVKLVSVNIVQDPLSQSLIPLQRPLHQLVCGLISLFPAFAKMMLFPIKRAILGGLGPHLAGLKCACDLVCRSSVRHSSLLSQHTRPILVF